MQPHPLLQGDLHNDAVTADNMIARSASWLCTPAAEAKCGMEAADDLHSLVKLMGDLRVAAEEPVDLKTVLLQLQRLEVAEEGVMAEPLCKEGMAAAEVVIQEMAADQLTRLVKSVYDAAEKLGVEPTNPSVIKALEVFPSLQLSVRAQFHRELLEWMAEGWADTNSKRLEFDDMLCELSTWS